MKKTVTKLLSFLIICLSLAFTCCFMSSAVSVKNNPAQVKNLKASSVSNTTAKLSWNKISGVKYVIYTYNPSSKKYTKVNTTANNSYTVKAMKEGTTYHFCVQAYKIANEKNYYGKKSDIIKVTTKVANPAQVKNLKATSTENTVKLSWSKVSSTGYAVYSYDTAKKKYTYLGSTANACCTIKKLKSETVYRYAVRAYKTVNGKKYYGKYSETVKVTTKAPLNITQARKLYSNAIDVYMNWIHSCTYVSNKDFVKKELYGMLCNFAPVNHPEVKTMSDLKKLLSRYFDSSIYEKDLYLYTEIFGKLYYYAEGGVAEGITGVQYYTDSLKKINNTKYEYTLTPKYYSSGKKNSKAKQFKFTLIKQNGQWIFTGKFYPCKGQIKTNK